MTIWYLCILCVRVYGCRPSATQQCGFFHMTRGLSNRNGITKNGRIIHSKKSKNILDACMSVGRMQFFDMFLRSFPFFSCMACAFPAMRQGETLCQRWELCVVYHVHSVKTKQKRRQFSNDLTVNSKPMDVHNDRRAHSIKKVLLFLCFPLQ